MMCSTVLSRGFSSIHTAAKVAVCTSSFAYDDGRRPQFEIQYDKAVVAVGEQPATFGVKGVKEHCFFMKGEREQKTCVGTGAALAGRCY